MNVWQNFHTPLFGILRPKLRTETAHIRARLHVLEVSSRTYVIIENLAYSSSSEVMFVHMLRVQAK